MVKKLFKQLVQYEDGMHEETYEQCDFKIQELEGTFKIIPFYEGLFKLLNTDAIRLRKGNKMFGEVHLDDSGVSIPETEDSLCMDGEEIGVSFSRKVGDWIVAPFQGVIVSGIVQKRWDVRRKNKSKNQKEENEFAQMHGDRRSYLGNFSV